MNLGKLMLDKRSNSQKTTYGMIPFHFYEAQKQQNLNKVLFRDMW